MKNITKLLLTTSLFASSFAVKANILTEWHGFWQGECQYQEPGTTSIELIPFTIDISPISSTEVTWNMHYYRASGDIVKNYTVRLIDEATGHYVTDENNGILIDEYLRQNKLMSHFEVGKRQITIASELNGNNLSYTAYAFGTSIERRSRASGTTVLTYGEPALEACQLSRQKPNQLIIKPI